MLKKPEVQNPSNSPHARSLVRRTHPCGNVVKDYYMPRATWGGIQHDVEQVNGLLSALSHPSRLEETLKQLLLNDSHINEINPLFRARFYLFFLHSQS